MKASFWIWVLAALGVMSACSAPERARNIGASASATALAAQVCSNCHGINGNSTSPNFPNLAAQQETYIIEQLKSFKRHGRFDPAGFEYMWGLSRNLSDEQINELAVYFAKQTPRANPPGDPQRVSAGQKIFEQGVPAQNIPACLVCHGAQGQGNGGFPRIANQHADYLIKQLHVFQRTESRPQGAVMKQVAHLLTDENVDAVATYLEAMPVK